MQIRMVIALTFAFVVSVSAQNRSRSLEDIKVRFDTGRGDVFAVVVGISNYHHAGIRDLSYADDDARAFARFLQSDKGGRVPSENIRALIDQEATYVDIRSALLDWLPEKANKRDHTALVFFAGHGIVHRNTPLFLAQNTDPEKLIGSSVSMDVVNDAFDLVEAERKLFFGDACHSGALLGTQVTSRDFSGNMMLDRLKGRGRAVMTSSSNTESSYESQALRAGLFTHCLLQGLSGGADRDGDGYVVLTEIYDYTYQSVADSASGMGALQHPRMQADVDGAVLLAKVGRTAMEWQNLNADYDQKMAQMKQQIAKEETRIAQENAVRIEKEAAEQKARDLAAMEDQLRKLREQGSSGTKMSGKGDMVYIPAGSFQMGNNYLDDNEMPEHEVYVDGFYMDKYEVTVAEFRKYKASYQPYFKGCENCPAENVSWEDAKGYCESVGKRLPTEAEWEKACRGGLEGKDYPWGNEITVSQANYDDSGKGRTTEVGSYQPNGYGLYDMSGNVWEWVSDWYDSGYYAKSPGRNPENTISGTSRVLRGGSWGGLTYDARCSYRSDNIPDNRDYGLLGFRCVKK